MSAIKTVIIHGQSHVGSTCHIARALAEKLGGETTEFFLPRDFGAYCVACLNCFSKTEKMCPHYQALAPITQAIDAADVVILASPVYVFHATGAMKAFLDHYGYRWMVHSPELCMFKKQGVCIATAAGAGMRSTNKDMADSLFFWGVPRIYKIGVGMNAINWESASAKKKDAIDRRTTALAKQICARVGKVKPGLKTKAMFAIARLFQKKNGFSSRDARHWEAHGWFGKERSWD